MPDPTVRWALQQLTAATDALREAAGLEAQVRDLQRRALDLQQQALDLQAQATAAVRRSDRLRADVIGVLLVPDDPREITEMGYRHA